MNWAWYRAGRVVTRSIIFFTMRVRRMGSPAHPDGYVLAVSHQGHLDPFLAGSFQDRPIVWMTRKEFFHRAWARFAIRKLNGFCVDRQGIPVSSIRHAISLSRVDQVVGICPEGGVTRGPAACFRGGPIKRGLCSVSIHARVPVIPCLILGSAQLHRIGPWLPIRRARIWVGYGQPIFPPPRSTRQSRRQMAGQIQSAYVQLFADMCTQLQVDQNWLA